MSSPVQGSHGRTLSEAQLLNLHLNFTHAAHFTPVASPSAGQTCSTSRISDEDLDTLFTPLQKSEFESEEDEFARKAELALQRLSAGVTTETCSSRAAAAEERFSPFSFSPLPAYEGGENPYFRWGEGSKTVYSNGEADLIKCSPQSFKTYSANGVSPQSSDGSISSGGDSFSSAYTNSDTTSSCLDEYSFASNQLKSALAARRGKSSESLKLSLPPRNSANASSAPTTGNGFSPETMTRTLSVRKSEGILRNNFQGVALPKTYFAGETEFSVDLDSPLFRKPRKNNGFAF